MGDWSLLEGQLVDTVGENLATSTGTTVAGGVANTKGNWVQLIAATTYAADAITVNLTQNNTGYDYLVDIGVGAADSEVVLVPDLLSGLYRSDQGITYLLPIGIPAGTRIAGRCQSSTAGGIICITIGLLSQGFMPSAPLGRVTAYGANAADSGGTQVDPGLVAHTKNAYSQINGATTAPIRAILIGIGSQINSAATACRWLIDIAIGAGGSEQIIMPDMILAANSSSDDFLPATAGPFFIDIPAGTRLAARAQCSIVNGTDRLFDIVLYGID